MMPLSHVSALVMLYNLLAFGCQPMAGWLADRLRRPREVALVGLPLLAASLLVMRAQPILAVTFAGIGSATFHVGGGALALCATRGRASGPGLFAAPGVAGLTLGGLLAATNHILIWPFLLLTVILGVAIAALEAPALPYDEPRAEPLFEKHDVVMLTLLAAIALRSLVWTTLQYFLQGRLEIIFALGMAAASGKLLGGFLADRFGWRRWTMGALLASALLLNVGGGQLWTLMFGVALLQSATPVALAATVQLMPRQPATAAGLALGLAIALGGMPMMGGWGFTLGSPPILSLIALAAAILIGLALTLQKRKGAYA